MTPAEALRADQAAIAQLHQDAGEAESLRREVAALREQLALAAGELLAARLGQPLPTCEGCAHFAPLPSHWQDSNLNEGYIGRCQAHPPTAYNNAHGSGYSPVYKGQRCGEWLASDPDPIPDPACSVCLDDGSACGICGCLGWRGREMGPGGAK